MPEWPLRLKEPCWRQSAAFDSAEEGVGHVGGGGGDFDAGGFQGFNFALGGAFASADDRSGLAHAAAGRGGGSGVRAFVEHFHDIEMGSAVDRV